MNNKVIIGSLNKLRYIANTSFVIISKRGTVIVVDPFKVDSNIKPDLIAVTHTHYDHYNREFIDRCNCPQMIAQTGYFEYRDIKVTGVASSHLGDVINEKEPDNVIYIFEVDGIRIAHFGDAGQNLFTEHQLREIGTIDIAMMQFSNPNSECTLSNGKGFTLLKQIKPSLVIPTHAFGLKSGHLGKKYFLFPVHGVGKTLRYLTKNWGTVVKVSHIGIVKEEIDRSKQEVNWINRTLNWRDVCLLRETGEFR